MPSQVEDVLCGHEVVAIQHRMVVKIPDAPGLKPFFRQSGEDLRLWPFFLDQRSHLSGQLSQGLNGGLCLLIGIKGDEESVFPEAEPPGTIDGALPYGKSFSIRVMGEDSERIIGRRHFKDVEDNGRTLIGDVSAAQAALHVVGPVNFAGSVDVIENRLTVVELIFLCLGPVHDFFRQGMLQIFERTCITRGDHGRTHP